MKAILDHVDTHTSNIATLWFKPERRIDYTAGQFVELIITHNNPDNRGQKRWFTLSSSPSESLVSITTKFAAEAGTGSTFKTALRNLKPGDDVNISDAMGDFVLPKNTEHPIIYVAGGIGITPAISMIKWSLDNNQSRDFTLFYTANKPEEIIYKDLFAQPSISFKPVVKEPDAKWSGASGSLSAEEIAQVAEAKQDSLVYLAGPEPMVEAFVSTLKKNGVEDRRIATDFFPGYTSL